MPPVIRVEVDVGPFVSLLGHDPGASPTGPRCAISIEVSSLLRLPDHAGGS